MGAPAATLRTHTQQRQLGNVMIRTLALLTLLWLLLSCCPATTDHPPSGSEVSILFGLAGGQSIFARDETLPTPKCRRSQQLDSGIIYVIAGYLFHFTGSSGQKKCKRRANEWCVVDGDLLETCCCCWSCCRGSIMLVLLLLFFFTWCNGYLFIEPGCSCSPSQRG